MLLRGACQYLYCCTSKRASICTFVLSSILCLAMRLAECIYAGASGGGEGGEGGVTSSKGEDPREWGGLVFFLELLENSNELKRRMAVVGLGVVFPCFFLALKYKY
jgi:hypothetical protein